MKPPLYLLMLFCCLAQFSSAVVNPQQMKAAVEWGNFQLKVKNEALVVLEAVKDKPSADKSGEQLLIIYAHRVQKGHPSIKIWEKGLRDAPAYCHVSEKDGDMRLKFILKTIEQINKIKKKRLIIEKFSKVLGLMEMENC